MKNKIAPALMLACFATFGTCLGGEDPEPTDECSPFDFDCGSEDRQQLQDDGNAETGDEKGILGSATSDYFFLPSFA